LLAKSSVFHQLAIEPVGVLVSQSMQDRRDPLPLGRPKPMERFGEEVIANPHQAGSAFGPFDEAGGVLPDGVDLLEILNRSLHRRQLLLLAALKQLVE
jgi:hypothetical protein